MNGIKMTELYELISHNHEAEFEYDGTTYILQPIANDEKAWLIIDCVDTFKRLCQHEIPMSGNIPQSVIDAVFSEKCFNGKSFIEIEKDITVTVTY